MQVHEYLIGQHTKNRFVNVIRLTAAKRVLPNPYSIIEHHTRTYITRSLKNLDKKKRNHFYFYLNFVTWAL